MYKYVINDIELKYCKLINKAKEYMSEIKDLIIN